MRPSRPKLNPPERPNRLQGAQHEPQEAPRDPRSPPGDPRKLPGGAQEAPRRLPGGTRRRRAETFVLGRPSAGEKATAKIQKVEKS